MTDELASLSLALEHWLFQHALPLWWSVGADRVGGGFCEVIDQHGCAPARARRARVQTRQVFVYATAAALGWEGPWLQAVQHGLDFFLARYTRPDGLFRTRLEADGTEADGTAVLYDHAFALLALSAAQALPPTNSQDGLRANARALWERMRLHFRHPGGGYLESEPGRPFQSNPHMHLLEAALAWGAIDSEGPWRALADEIAELCLEHFVDRRTGALREFFDARWSPAPGLDGRIVEPGHQFEWAWLLVRWGLARGREDALMVARRMFEIGAGPGVDRGRGVALQQLLDDFSPHDPSARLWPQTERIRAALILADISESDSDADRLRSEALLATKSLRRFLETPIEGLWWDRLDVHNRFVAQAAPASSFYHIIGAVCELRLRIKMT